MKGNGKKVTEKNQKSVIKVPERTRKVLKIIIENKNKNIFAVLHMSDMYCAQSNC